MQRDDELKGPGNALDFGARMYDSRLGRWMSVDQLAGKYPNLSPFNFTANNPVLYVDFDGRDYHVHVNHSSKTIIVRATVYVTEGNSQEQASAMMAADFWNGQSCNFQYNINSDGKMQSYDIKFELTVKEHNSPEEAAYEDESGNSYLLRPDDWVEFSKNDRGFTEKGQFIFIKDSRKDSDTGPHELGHTLGLDHWELGIMTEGVKGLDRVNQITAEQVSQILNMAIPELNAGVYTPNGSNSSGSVVPVNANSSADNSSLTPSNFNNGRVSAVRDN